MCFETTGFASRFDSIFCCIPHAIINGKKCYFIEEEYKNCKRCLQQKRRELKATKRKLGGRAVKTEEINKTKCCVRKERIFGVGPLEGRGMPMFATNVGTVSKSFS